MCYWQAEFLHVACLMTLLIFCGESSAPGHSPLAECEASAACTNSGSPHQTILSSSFSSLSWSCPQQSTAADVEATVLVQLNFDMSNRPIRAIKPCSENLSCMQMLPLMAACPSNIMTALTFGKICSMLLLVKHAGQDRICWSKGMRQLHVSLTRCSSSERPSHRIKRTIFSTATTTSTRRTCCACSSGLQNAEAPR